MASKQRAEAPSKVSHRKAVMHLPEKSTLLDKPCSGSVKMLFVNSSKQNPTAYLKNHTS